MSQALSAERYLARLCELDYYLEPYSVRLMCLDEMLQNLLLPWLKLFEPHLSLNLMCSAEQQRGSR